MLGVPMVGWLAKAAQVLRPAPPEPQAFEVGCSCGNRLAGLRASTYQKVPCARCGNLVFVLPADVYPKPKRKKAPPKTLPAQSQHDPVLAARVAETKTPPPLSMTPPTERPAAAATAKTAPPPRAVPVEIVEAAGPKRSFFRTFFSPLRLTILALLMVSAAAGYWILQTQLKESAERSLQGYLDSGEAALCGGRCPGAAQAYRNAAQAVDRLGREDTESLGIRREAAELNAIVGLSTASLLEICEDARRARLTGPISGRKSSTSFIATGGSSLRVTLFRNPARTVPSCRLCAIRFRLIKCRSCWTRNSNRSSRCWRPVASSASSLPGNSNR